MFFGGGWVEMLGAGPTRRATEPYRLVPSRVAARAMENQFPPVIELLFSGTPACYDGQSYHSCNDRKPQPIPRPVP